MDTNIFVELTKFTSSPENSLTEALVLILNILRERDRKRAVTIIGRLTGLQDIFTKAETIFINTQVAHEEGRPDIEIVVGDYALIHVEVKHDAALSPGQLERYWKYLQQTHYPVKQLVLLSRSKDLSLETTLASNQYHHIRWDEIHQCLSGLCKEEDAFDEISQYLVSIVFNIQMATWCKSANPGARVPFGRSRT